MNIFRTVRALRNWRDKQENRRSSISFVPTMGALHKGHQSLIVRARKTCDKVVVSIFVNPLQFGPSEDYHLYPRELSQDLAICRKENVDIVFIPKLEDLYTKDFQTTVTVKTLGKFWEGKCRPMHFQGVTTIATKLLNLIHPSRTFFGQKDYQQFLVIRQLVKDLELKTKLTLCPTIRDSDGLALSSRNRYLTHTQREQALTLYQALSAGKHAIVKGERQSSLVDKIMLKVVKATSNCHIDYLVCCNAATLEPLSDLKGKVILLGALRVGSIRLIDNLLVQIPQ